MGRAICKISHEGEDYYLIWSSIVDSFVTYGMKLDEFTEWIREEEGTRYMREDHDGRMARVEEHGTSWHGTSLEECIVCNRCGPHEEHLSLEGIIDMYIVNRGSEEYFLNPRYIIPYVEDEND